MAHQAGREAPGDRLNEPEPPALVALAVRVGAVALARGMHLGTAESCTGGLIGHAITEVPGASAWYLGGVVSYADAVKVELLAVPAAAIRRHGAVSAQVAVAMAEGVRERLGCDLGIAVTGVAGPDGGTPAKPVGLTYVAVAGDGIQEVRRHQWEGDRTANKAMSAAAALHLLIEVLGETAETAL